MYVNLIYQWKYLKNELLILMELLQENEYWFFLLIIFLIYFFKYEYSINCLLVQLSINTFF